MEHVNGRCVGIDLAKQIQREVGCRVHVLNPGKLAIIYQSTRKTDKEDAHELAWLIMRYPEEELPVVSVPDDREERMRSMVTMKQYLLKMHTSMLIRLHAIYVQAGMTFVKKSELALATSRERMAARLSGFLSRHAALLEHTIVATEEEIAALEKDIHEMVAEHELAPFVISIPGFGPGVAAAFLAFIGDGRRFSGPEDRLLWRDQSVWKNH